MKQYGPNLRAFAVNLLTQGYVGIDRTRQILEGLGVPVSTGTLQNFLDSCAAETEAAADEIRKKVAALNVIHCDETGVDVNGKLHWMHCLCNNQWSYCTVHEKRGSAAMDEIGVIPSLDNSTLVHDFWSAYLKYDNVKHSFCNTHLERELIYAFETTGQAWANALNKLLSEMCGKRNELKKGGASCYPSELLASYFKRYDALVAEGLEANPIKEAPKGKRGRKAKGKNRCLLERLRDYKADILRFASDWSVPFTNNEAERCVRFSKVKEKVSGCFRTKTGADNFMRIMSYIGSAKKHGIDAEMMFCTTFEPLMEEDVFRNIVRKNSFFLNRQQLRWVTSRFQIRDRINHVAFIFEVRNDFKEIYLITVMVAGEGEKIQLKRSTICFDIAPSYASYDGTVVSQVTALDWRNLYNCRGIPMARVEITASDYSWEY